MLNSVLERSPPGRTFARMRLPCFCGRHVRKYQVESLWIGDGWDMGVIWSCMFSGIKDGRIGCV